jgi:hypothetical protein
MTDEKEDMMKDRAALHSKSASWPTFQICS